MQDLDIIKTLETAADAPDEPFALFGQWLETARQSEPGDHNAMCLATADEEGRPQARMVLLKSHDREGFVFYTNKQSRKGKALTENPYAALCFYWKSLGRQVQIQGPVEHVSEEEADAYFASRPAGSRIGAWASKQSQKLESRSALLTAIEEYQARYPDDTAIPRPPHWGGYRVVPERIEFWDNGAHRLHTRIVYQRAEGGWEKKMLFP